MRTYFSLNTLSIFTISLFYHVTNCKNLFRTLLTVENPSQLGNVVGDPWATFPAVQTKTFQFPRISNGDGTYSWESAKASSLTAAQLSNLCSNYLGFEAQFDIDFQGTYTHINTAGLQVCFHTDPAAVVPENLSVYVTDFMKNGFGWPKDLSGNNFIVPELTYQNLLSSTNGFSQVLMQNGTDEQGKKYCLGGSQFQSFFDRAVVKSQPIFLTFLLDTIQSANPNCKESDADQVTFCDNTDQCTDGLPKLTFSKSDTCKVDNCQTCDVNVDTKCWTCDATYQNINNHKYCLDSDYTCEVSNCDVCQFSPSNDPKVCTKCSGNSTFFEDSACISPWSKTKITGLQDTNSELQTNLTAEEAKSAKLQKNLTEKTTENQELQANLTAEEAKNTQLTQDLATKTKLAEDLQTNLTTEEAKNTNLTKQLEDKQKENDQLNATNQALNQDLTQEIALNKELQKNLTAEEQKNADLSKNITDTQKLNEELRANLTIEEERNQNLTDENQQLNANLTIANKLAEDLQKNLTAEENKNKDLKKNYDDEVARNANLTTQLQTEQEKNTNLTQENKQLNESLADLQEQYQEEEKNYAAANKTISNLNSSLIQLQSDYQHEVDLNTQANQQIKQLNDTIADLQEQYQEEEKIIKEANNTITELSNTLNETQEELVKQKQDYVQVTKLWQGIVMGWAITTVLLAVVICRLKRLINKDYEEVDIVSRTQAQYLQKGGLN